MRDIRYVAYAQYFRSGMEVPGRKSPWGTSLVLCIRPQQSVALVVSIYFLGLRRSETSARRTEKTHHWFSRPGRRSQRDRRFTPEGITDVIS